MDLNINFIHFMLFTISPNCHERKLLFKFFNLKLNYFSVVYNAGFEVKIQLCTMTVYIGLRCISVTYKNNFLFPHR